MGDALAAGVEAHQGRGVRNTSDAMTVVGANPGDHEVSKSRRSTAS
jgi:hypothetical protein